MNKIKNKNWAFTLVELLVVITILAIISVVAYQNFWGAVDKANAGRKINDVTTIETSLIQYKSAENLYPAVWVISVDNMWGYDSSVAAWKSNSIIVTYDWEEIDTVDTWTWWGIIYQSWSTDPTKQIWAKWTIWKDQLGKYLTKDLYDPELWDTKVNDIDWAWNAWIMIDKWIGRYVYAIYKKSFNWPTNQRWSSYNIAFTIKDDLNEDWYITKIVWDYDPANLNTPSDYPNTLIWDWTNPWLENKDVQTTSSDSNDYWIPYAVTDFSK